MVNVEESSAFLFADEVMPYLARVPKNVFGRPLAWLGAYGLEPMDREVARYLKLESRFGAVVSEVLAGRAKPGVDIEGWDGRAAERIVDALVARWA